MADVSTALAKESAAMARHPWGGLLAACCVGVIGSYIFMVLPLLIAALTRAGAFTLAQAGIVGAAPLVGMFAGSVGTAALLGHVRWRTLVLSGAAGLAGCYVLSIPAAASLPAIVAVQFVAGVSGVVLMSVAFAWIGSMAAPDRNFALFIALQMSAGALGVLALERLIDRSGLTGVFLGLALFSSAALLALPAVERGERARAQHTAARGARLTARGLAVLLGQLAFGAAIMLIWSFAAPLGESKGLASEGVARALSVALFASIAGALTAAAIGRRLPRLALLAAGSALLAAASLAVVQTPSATLFVAAIAAFAFGWNFLPAFQLGIASELDCTGRLVVLDIATVKLGYALGTASGGALSQQLGFAANALLACACLLLALLLFGWAERAVEAHGG